MPEPVVVDDMVERYYNDIFNRNADSGGKAFWASEIVRLQGLGVDSREAFRTIAKQFFFGAEYLGYGYSDGEFLTDLYQAFYQRQPDSGGFGFWSGQLPTIRREGVHNSFMLAPEFSNHMQRQLGAASQRADTALVVDAFRGFLGRVPDTGGFNTWVGHIRYKKCVAGNVTQGAADLMYALLHSAEYINRGRTNDQFLNDVYESMAQRGPDAAGFNFWLDRLANQGYSRWSVVAEWFGSAEWQQRVALLQADPC